MQRLSKIKQLHKNTHKNINAINPPKITPGSIKNTNKNITNDDIIYIYI